MPVVSHPESSPLGFSDIDHTMTPLFTLFPICQGLADEGFITTAANERIQEAQSAFEAGEIDYKTFVTNAVIEAAQALKDRRVSVTEELTRDFIAQEIEFFPWVVPTFQDIEQLDGSITIVSAEPAFITRSIASLFGADYFSTELETAVDETYTGVLGRVLGSSQKGALVQAKIARTASTSVYCFGDSEGDIDMLNQASPIVANAFCVSPDPALLQHAHATGMTIIDNPYIAHSLLKTI